MDDRLDACLARLLHAVPPREGEERIGRQHRALDLFSCLLDRDLYRLDPVRLPATHAKQPAVLGDRDGIALDVLDAKPRKLQVVQLRRGRLSLAHARELNVFGCQTVRLLTQPPRGHLSEPNSRRCTRLCLQNPQRLRLALEHLEPLLCVSRSDDNLIKHPRLPIRRRAELPDLPRHVLVNRRVERHNAPKRGNRIRPHRTPVRLEQVPLSLFHHAHTTRIRVLDDHATRVFEIRRHTERRLGIQVIVVTHLLPMMLRCRPHTTRTVLPQTLVRVNRRLLVRVLPVSRHLLQPHRHRHLWLHRPVSNLPPQPLADQRIITAAMLERLPRQIPPLRLRHPTLLRHLTQKVCVIARIDHHAHMRVVLGRRPNHRRTTNINILNPVGVRHARLCHRGAERVQVDHQHVNHRNVMGGSSRHMRLVVTTRQQATVHPRMQRLDPAVHHFRKPRQLLHALDRDPIPSDGRLGAPGRHQHVPSPVQSTGQRLQVRLVRHGDQRVTRRGGHCRGEGHGCTGCTRSTEMASAARRPMRRGKRRADRRKRHL
mmetsp:Transcript_10065/g.27390  ORF Transcript_10065/g.27390 Transcript_10065/m.27390 type:complete len:542 (+) Transcript_10065:2169-3794(+)